MVLRLVLFCRIFFINKFVDRESNFIKLVNDISVKRRVKSWMIELKI